MKKTNYVKPTQQTVKNKIINIVTYLCIQFSIIFACCSTCFAEGQGPAYAKNGATWLLGQLFWVAVVVTVIIFIKNLMARNTVSSIVTFIVGAIVCFFIKNPTIFETVGDLIAKAIGLQ